MSRSSVTPSKLSPVRFRRVFVALEPSPANFECGIGWIMCALDAMDEGYRKPPSAELALGISRAR
jgi:hypothetical protein